MQVSSLFLRYFEFAPLASFYPLLVARQGNEQTQNQVSIANGSNGTQNILQQRVRCDAVRCNMCEKVLFIHIFRWLLPFFSLLVSRLIFQESKRLKAKNWIYPQLCLAPTGRTRTRRRCLSMVSEWTYCWRSSFNHSSKGHYDVQPAFLSDG